MFQILPTAATVTSLRSTAPVDADSIARTLGYIVGAGSFVLYTPIAIRIGRQGRADGLALSTWWLKLGSYGCSDIYAYTRGYPVSTYVETLVITAEALVILVLVAYYQRRMDRNFAATVATFGATATWLLTTAPPEVVALGQGGSAVLNTAALAPQFLLNAELRTAGDYSPLTAGLAATGCLIRLFTTMQLAGSDPLLLGSFGLALFLNGSLLLQILWYGVVVEGRDIVSVLTADFGPKKEEEKEASL